MNVTKHAIRRIRQRLGVRKKERARKIASQAFYNGTPLKKLPEEVKKFVDENCHGAKVLIHKNFIYIFRGNNLITLFNLPQDLHFISETDKRKKEQLEKEKAKREQLKEIISKRDREKRRKIAEKEWNESKCWDCKGKKFIEIFYEECDRFQLQCMDCGRMSKRLKSVKLCEDNLRRKFIARI